MAHTDSLILFVGGSIGGLLAGLLGVGGGIIFVVILSFYLEKIGVPESALVPAILANSLFAIFFSGISGSIKQYLAKNFFPKEIIQTAIPAAFSSIAVTYLINSGHWYTRERFTIFFLALLSFIAYRILKGRKQEGLPELPEKQGIGYRLFIGFFTGIISAFSGIGGGVIMIPFYTELMHFNLKKATGISLGVIMVMSGMLSAYTLCFEHALQLNLPYTMGLLVFPVVLPLVIGTVLFAPYGVTLSHKLSTNTIRIIFFVFVTAVILKMLIGLL